MKVFYNTIISLSAALILLGMVKFSHPSGLGLSGSPSAAQAHIMSTQELQRELNRRYPEAKLIVDGKCGRETQRWWDRAYGDQTAISLWPEATEK